MGENKIKGNTCFQEGKFQEAIAFYKSGLNENINSNEKCVLYKNLAQCCLNLKEYEEAETYANEALKLNPTDVKALYRLCLAQQGLNNLSSALTNCRRLLKLEAKNASVIKLCRELESLISKMSQEEDSVHTKLNRMMKIILEDSNNNISTVKADDNNNRLIKAVNNIASLLTEESAHDYVWAHLDRDSALLDLLRKEQIHWQLLDCVQRCIALLITHRPDWAQYVVHYLGGTDSLILRLYHSDSNVVHCEARFLQAILYSLSQLKTYICNKEKYESEANKNKKKVGPALPYPAISIDPLYQQTIHEIFIKLIKLIDSRKVSACARDVAIETLIKFVGRTHGVNWISEFLKHEAVSKTLEVASTVRSHALLTVTKDTKMNGAVLLAKVFDDIYSDSERQAFLAQCKSYVMDLISDDLIESKVDAASAIALLLMGPYDVGAEILSQPGILEGMLLIVRSENAEYQKISLETLIVASSKKDKCMAVVDQAVPILKELYKTGKDYVKIRALVGLCKLGSAGGTDASIRTMAEGSTLSLAKSCLKFLSMFDLSENLDKISMEERDEMCRWAVEGLCYLTLDADVKELIVHDEKSRRGLQILSEKEASVSLFPLCTILVNVTNSYDRPEILPEMLELAKFSQQHVPEDHPKDNQEFVRERLRILMQPLNEGAPALFPRCLYCLNQVADKLDSDASRELIARCYLTIVTEVEYRGAVVQSGGGKCLISLALKNTAEGRIFAAQALAKIAITSDPRIAFPGQRAMETIRPLLPLLNIERKTLQNFEALMALTNLASLGDAYRRRILSEGGFAGIENYVYDDYEPLRRAACECMCNLVMLEDVAKYFIEGENDRIKLMLLYCADGQEENDLALVRACSGCLAILSEYPEVCHKITKVKDWIDILQLLAAHEDIEIQYRGAFILRNMMNADRSLCESMVSTNMLEVFMAMSQMPFPGREKARDCALDALKIAQDHGLIQKSQ